MKNTLCGLKITEMSNCKEIIDERQYRNILHLREIWGKGTILCHVVAEGTNIYFAYGNCILTF